MWAIHLRKYYLKKNVNLTLYSNHIYTKKGKIWRRLTTTTSTQRKIQIPCTSCKPICFCFVFCPLFYIYTYLFYFILFYFISLFYFILFYFNHTFCCAWYFCYTYIPQDFPQTEPRELTDQVISSIDTPQYKVFEKEKGVTS